MPHLRLLRRLAVLLGVMLAAAFIIVAAALAVNISRYGSSVASGVSAGVPPWRTGLSLVGGERLAFVAADRGWLYLHIEDRSTGAGRVVAVDGASGSVAGVVELQRR